MKESCSKGLLAWTPGAAASHGHAGAAAGLSLREVLLGQPLWPSCCPVSAGHVPPHSHCAPSCSCVPAPFLQRQLHLRVPSTCVLSLAWSPSFPEVPLQHLAPTCRALDAAPPVSRMGGDHGCPGVDGHGRRTGNGGRDPEGAACYARRGGCSALLGEQAAGG